MAFYVLMKLYQYTLLICIISLCLRLIKVTFSSLSSIGCFFVHPHPSEKDIKLNVLKYT